MRNLQEIIGFLLKNSVIFKSVCFNNDRAITQNTLTCVENCSDINYHIFVCLLITRFSVTLIITLKTVCFLVRYVTNLLLGHVHKA